MHIIFVYISLKNLVFNTAEYYETPLLNMNYVDEIHE